MKKRLARRGAAAALACLLAVSIAASRAAADAIKLSDERSGTAAAHAGKDRTKSSSSAHLKWRSPNVAAPFESAATNHASANPAPRSFESETAPRPAASTVKRTSSVTVQRLADADPSPHSQPPSAAGGSSLAIIQTAATEPKIDPFADELAAPKLRKVPQTRRTVRAGLQESSPNQPPRDPFADDQPRLEQVPSQPPETMPEGDELTQGPRAGPALCPSPKDLKSMNQITPAMTAEPGEFPTECGLGEELFLARNWAMTTYAWKASALCHKPLYFEDVALERYGHTISPLFQPLISAAEFWLTVPILPYKFGLEPPCECIYDLGYYRPGSCAPYIIPPVPVSVRGALLEAGAWVAGVALVP